MEKQKSLGSNINELLDNQSQNEVKRVYDSNEKARKSSKDTMLGINDK